jgi:AAA15 family ATPase/GTPase
MKLIYLYINDDGKNIKDCEFNFSPEYRISYDRKQRFITVEKNDNYLPDFWEVSNISNITAIIGKNGAGKSNLLEFIFRYYTSASGLRNVTTRNIIHIYRLNGELYTNRSDIPCNISLREKHYKSYPLNNFNKDVNTELIYYSPHYEKMYWMILVRELHQKTFLLEDY